MSKRKELKPKQRILETALNLFYNQGYLATGINQIIREAEVSKASFYDHFSSKEKLCIAYLQERNRRWSCRLKDKIDEFDKPIDRFMAPLVFLDTWLPSCDFRGCAFINIASEVPGIESEIRQEVISAKTRLKTLLRQLAENLKKSSEYSHLDIDFIGNAYYVIMEGTITACQIYRQIWPIEEARKSLKKLLLGD